MNENIKRAETILDTIHGYIKGADQKVSIFLGFEGISLTLLIPNYLKTITERFRTNTMSFWIGLFIVLATVSLIYSIFKSLSAIFPRLNNKVTSHLYFGSIKNLTLTEFKHAMHKMKDGEYLDELYEQIHTNSNIADAKHKNFQVSVIFFLIGMGLLVLSYMLLKFF